MKKLFIILVTWYLLPVTCKAQTWVTIPDANFVSYLQGSFPTAMSGNQLNITSTVVTTYNYQMNVSGQSIANLFGVQYFTSIPYLDCSNNSLTSLPTLPNSIQNLSCYTNSLTTLPALPTSLKYLICYSNSLTSLPALPDSLIYLYCSYNQLTSIPALPSYCKGYYCDLYCDNNLLTSLPVLPDSLNQLTCGNNNIACFPPFPISINRYSGPGTIPFSITPNPYNCLPNYIAAMGSDTVTYPKCAAGNTNGCAVAGIQQVAGINNQVTVYPNPANESLTLTLSQGEGTVNISMYDMLGKLVMQHTYSPPSEGQGEALDVSDLSEGVYNLSISTSDGVGNKRVVIER